MKLPKITRNKKAVFFNILLVVITTIFLAIAYVVLSSKTSVEKEIGEHPLEVILKIQEGEKALIFLDYAAKFALDQSIYDLQNQGGLTAAQNCGAYFGFNLWNSAEGSNCVPEQKNVSVSLEKLFVSNLIARISKYPQADFISNLQLPVLQTPQPTAVLSQIPADADISKLIADNSLTVEDVEYLTRVQKVESASGSSHERGAIMQVAINRVELKKYGGMTIKEVVTAMRWNSGAIYQERINNLSYGLTNPENKKYAISAINFLLGKGEELEGAKLIGKRTSFVHRQTQTELGRTIPEWNYDNPVQVGSATFS